MRRKIDVTPSEMLEMRAEGMSNHDIAKSLDISYATVVKYIGKQGGRMVGLDAFRDTTVKKETATQENTMYEAYAPKPVVERFKIGDIEVSLYGEDKQLEFDGLINGLLDYEQLPDLVQFLAWAMRVKM